MWKKLAMQYLTLSKKDRYAIVILLCLYLIVTVVPRLLPSRATLEDADHQHLISEVATLFADSSSRLNEEERSVASVESVNARPPVLFHFDPNTATIDQWVKLGVSEKTANTIKKYISKGGKFRKPDDILKIYTLDKKLAARLLPYIQIPENETSPNSATRGAVSLSTTDERPRYEKQYSVTNVSIADTAQLKTLPGIGSRLASRIVAYRNLLGGFTSADQIAEVRFLHDSVFQKLRPFLIVDPTTIERLNLNTGTVETLGKHPYIGFHLAKAIVSYREQHGVFKSVSDLKLLHSVSPEKYEQIKPYLTVDD